MGSTNNIVVNRLDESKGHNRMIPTGRAAYRPSFGPLLSVSEAVRVLGIRATDARVWLHRHELISEALGAGVRRRVVLVDLLQAIRDQHLPEPRPQPRTRGRQRLPRVRL
jgi:hypothetical protein